ncbi:hypothetical protein [Aestuariirhabdus sp. LZHN29]|uniref:hypothetical protein n=1 Tax=Aestuariirhabdus sp. LZHN29 TaxID=3417462 RepID=UPI003CF0BD9E
MLNLFANIFGRADEITSKLPAALVGTAIERAVDGTDPRLRMVPRYAKKLKKPVLYAADYIIDMIDSLPEPSVVSQKTLASDPALSALFYSPEGMGKIVSCDPAMREFRELNPLWSGPVTALLVANRIEKRGFGYAQVGELVIRDVPRTTVGFEEHRFLEPAVKEQDTRFQLKRRAFDYLLSVALSQLTERKDERASLTGHKALLRSKLNIIQRGGGFGQSADAGEQVKLQERLKETESQLAALGASEDVLTDNLAIVIDVLRNAESHLWLEQKSLCIDKLYIVHDKPSAAAPKILFNDCHNSEGRQITLRMVDIELE